MRLDPKRLLDLLAVSRHGSFSAAADATGVSQPGLSQSIARLEHGLGVRVFERDRQGARLTDAGRMLAFHARAIESLLDRAKQETHLRSLGIEGPLAVGITPVSAATLVPQAIGLLLAETPRISVSLTEGLDDQLVAMLQAHEIDIVVGRLRPGIAGLASEQLVAADWALITRPNHPLASRDAVSLREIENVQWVLPAGGSAFRRQMETLFAAAGIGWPCSGVSTNSIIAIKSIVMRTECVTLMSPALVEVECATGRLRAVPLVDVIPMRPVGMTWREGDEQSPIVTRFAGALRSVATGSVHL